MPRSFDEFIREQRTRSTVTPDRKATLDEWNAAVSKLFDMVRSLLKPYVENGDIQIRVQPVRVSEEYLGEYEIDSMILTLGAQEVRFLPVGAYVIGAKGRVDLQGPRGLVKFVLVPKDSDRVRVRIGRSQEARAQDHAAADWAWKIATTPPNLRFNDIDKHSLQNAILEVADV